MDLTPLRHRDYRLLYVGQAVSLLGMRFSELTRERLQAHKDLGISLAGRDPELFL